MKDPCGAGFIRIQLGILPRSARQNDTFTKSSGSYSAMSLRADASHAFSTWFAERGSLLDDQEIASAVELPRNDTAFECG